MIHIAPKNIGVLLSISFVPKRSPLIDTTPLTRQQMTPVADYQATFVTDRVTLRDDVAAG